MCSGEGPAQAFWKGKCISVGYNIPQALMGGGGGGSNSNYVIGK